MREAGIADLNRRASMSDEMIFSMVIDGQLVSADSSLDVIDPATGTVFAKAPNCSRAQLDAAVTSSAIAFESWRNTDISVRRSALLSIAEVMEADAHRLSSLLTSEQGKPLADAAGEVAIAAARLRGTAALSLPEAVVERAPGRHVRVLRTPLGVVGAIAPWNFPISLAMQKVASALLAGNTVVLKPSPTTPLTTLLIGELVRHLLPPGVFNVVSGADPLGQWITEHSGVAKISFTGSVETGRRVMASAARDLKRVTLELGGNDAAVVFPGVDVSAVVEKVFWASFRNAGQICIAAKRIYVHSQIYDEFRDAFVAYARQVKVGNGAEPDVQIGPVQNLQQFRRISSLIGECAHEGHRFALGGTAPPEGGGYFLPLTIVDNPPDDSRLVAEEQFGPIVPLLRFTDTDDVVRRVNATRFGLACSVWSPDDAFANSVAERIDTGTVWINEAQSLSAAVPFGGHKDSGIGVEGGPEGLLEYTNAKVVTLPAVGEEA
jgi:acyl-CoA reductase-like NAD-dependent aldehyde dehydrogenase